MRARPNLGQRALLALWLTLAILVGLGNIPNVPFLIRQICTVALFIATLVLAILILVGVRSLLRYDIDILAAGIGLFVIVTNHVLHAVSGYEWFEGLNYFTSDWIRYITYALLGYSLAIRSRIQIAVLTSLAVALVDIMVGWVAVLPTLLRIIGLETFSDGLPYIFTGLL